MSIKLIKKIKLSRNSKDISFKELCETIRKNKEIILVDVRSPQEFLEGHLQRSN